ncbi:MAG: DUF1801 domain-containing protein [Candidatus Bathyarchaeota archaeon]|nr:DUF1801 domain-containing protein [Candidatus Bathyarchaeota archaeon]
MSNHLDAFLALFSRETRENVLCLRNLVFDVFPHAVEQVDPKAGIITYGYSGDPSGCFVFALVPHMKHVNLLFSQGALLSDPSGLLAGTGTLVRRVKIRSEAETQNPKLQALLKEALQLTSEH